jgi:3-hydroxybutyryl-CoA dehydrogenase
MSSKEIKTAAVIGAGTMGVGIVQVFAQSGLSVLWYDVNTKATEKGLQDIKIRLEQMTAKGKISQQQLQDTMANIKAVESLGQLQADLILEAAIENLAVKQQLFQQLEEHNAADTLLASNTSSLSITAIASGLRYPARLAGLHFFNPAPLMKLVEVVRGAATSEETVQALIVFCQQLGKQSVICRDAPGFIVNRVARPFYTESMRMLEEKVATVEGIDRLMESAGFRMGPFRLTDTIGQDINFAVTQSLYEAFHQEPRFRPSRIQEEKVKSGQLGRKTGKGFYEYGGEPS